MSHVFPRRCGVPMPVAVGGDGVYVVAADGQRYLDGSSGAAVSCLGHSNQALAEAIKRQIDSLSYAHTAFFTSTPAEELAHLLITHAPKGIGRAYFISGGSEAVEAAIKLARQYFVERGESQRRFIIARRQSYHGNTLGALAAGGNMWRRAMFEPLLFDGVEHIEECHYWRCGHAGESASDYAHRAADLLSKKIEELGAENVAAFIAEPVVGATMGAVSAPSGYFTRIREICNHYGILFIADEVMCGMGRTGTLFACEYENVTADIICIAKGLGAGMQPLSAMLCSHALYDTIADGSGFFQHGHTYSGHAVACAAGVAVLNEIHKHNLVTRVAQMGVLLEKQLREKLTAHPYVGDIRGRGLFWGVEFVQDKSDKSPFAPDKKIHAQIQATAFNRGLMVYGMGGTIDGVHGNHILIAPPFIISEEEISELVHLLADAINDVFG